MGKLGWQKLMQGGQPASCIPVLDPGPSVPLSPNTPTVAAYICLVLYYKAKGLAHGICLMFIRRADGLMDAWMDGQGSRDAETP